MRSYLFVANRDNIRRDSYTFDSNMHYAQRLMKDVGLYDVQYLLYDNNQQQVIEMGAISCIEYYEKERMGKVVFEHRQPLSTPFNMEIKENYNIIPLAMDDLKRIGINIV